MVLCDVRWSDAKECSYGDCKNYTDVLTKRYKNFTALNGLTMHIPKGSIYGFVGRNGAGKTTLIRLICGLQEPDSGSYRIYGIKNTDPQIVRSST